MTDLLIVYFFKNSLKLKFVNNNRLVSMNWLVYDHYGYAPIAVIGTFIALAGLQWVIQCKKLRTWNASLQGVAPPFINIIGVLFALTLAFSSQRHLDCSRPSGQGRLQRGRPRYIATLISEAAGST